MEKFSNFESNFNKKEEEKIKGVFKNIFNFFKSGKERIDFIAKQMDPYFHANLIKDGVKVKERILECAKEEDKDLFVQKIFEAAKPILVFFNKYPETRRQVEENFPEEFQREIFNINSGYEPVSDSISYGINEDKKSIHIHLPPSREIRKKGIHYFFDNVESGLKKLAKIVNENKDILEVTATSTVVASHPEAIERLGFIVDYDDFDLTTSSGKKVNNQVATSKMYRKDFLKRYLE